MQRNGMLEGDDVGWGQRREFHITKKGREHLAELREELSSAYDEVVRGVDPEHAARSGPASVAAPGSHIGGLDDISHCGSGRRTAAGGAADRDRTDPGDRRGRAELIGLGDVLRTFHRRKTTHLG